MSPQPDLTGPEMLAAALLEVNELKQCLCLLVARFGGQQSFAEDEIAAAPHYFLRIHTLEDPSRVVLETVMDVAANFTDPPKPTEWKNT